METYHHGSSWLDYYIKVIMHPNIKYMHLGNMQVVFIHAMYMSIYIYICI